MEKYYVYNNYETDGAYGSAYPVCFTESKAVAIYIETLRDYGLDGDEHPFEDYFREAYTSEIEEFGVEED